MEKLMIKTQLTEKWIGIMRYYSFIITGICNNKKSKIK
jgi:hypothetical protein